MTYQLPTKGFKMETLNVYKGDTVAVKVGSYLRRALTEKEKADWHNSDASKGMDSAGESKLCPRAVTLRNEGKDLYTVVRARCVDRLGWSEVPGCVELVDHDGVNWYARRRDVQAVRLTK